MAPLQVNDTLFVRDEELEERFIRSPGPGGQHVNKTATGVQLRFDLRNNLSLPEPVRSRLALLAGRRINQDGILVIEAHNYRSLQRNRQEAKRRLSALIRRAAHIPKKRQRTSPPRAAVERRLQRKRRQGDKKQQRQPPEY